MRTVTLGGFGDVAAAQAAASPLMAAQVAQRQQDAANAQHAISVIDAVPQLFLGTGDKATLIAARAVMQGIVTNQGVDTPPGQIRSTMDAVQPLYNTAIQRRMYVVGGLVVLGVGGFLYYRKR